MDESKKGPLIVFIKEIEKSLSGGGDSYSTLKGKLELMPQGVLVIGSHTQIDNRKEKVLPFSIRDMSIEYLLFSIYY